MENQPPVNPDALPPRIVTAEVLAIARFGRAKLRARIRAGLFPKPVDRGAGGDIFRKSDVLRALGLEATAPAVNPWEAALNDDSETAQVHGR